MKKSAWIKIRADCYRDQCRREPRLQMSGGYWRRMAEQDYDQLSDYDKERVRKIKKSKMKAKILKRDRDYWRGRAEGCAETVDRLCAKTGRMEDTIGDYYKRIQALNKKLRIAQNDCDLMHNNYNLMSSRRDYHHNRASALGARLADVQEKLCKAERRIAHLKKAHAEAQSASEGHYCNQVTAENRLRDALHTVRELRDALDGGAILREKLEANLATAEAQRDRLAREVANAMGREVMSGISRGFVELWEEIANGPPFPSCGCPVCKLAREKGPDCHCGEPQDG